MSSGMRCPRGTAHEELERLSNIETDECVLWPYSLNTSGYGQINHEGRSERVHRLSCERAHGAPPTPEHTDAAHSCRNRDCLNPRHLRWATRAENLADCVKDGTDNRGPRHSNAKLTVFDVQSIRHYAACGTKYQVLADHFGVARKTIGNLVRGTYWSWLK